MSRMIAPFVMRNFDGVLDGPPESYEAFLRAFMVNRLEFARKNFKILKILIQEIPFQPALGNSSPRMFSARYWSG